MSDPFLSEIKIMSFNFPPRGWATCNGQVLPINQNQALFSLLGTTYGGNGQTTFNLPNLQGRIPLHMGVGFPLGQQGGEALHTLTTQELPAHVHSANGTAVDGDTVIPASGALGITAGIYGAASSLTTLAPASISNSGGSQPHENMQPYLTLNFCISLQGIFPSRS